MRLINRHIIRSGRRAAAEPPEIPADALVIYWTTDSHCYSAADGGPGEDPNGPNATDGGSRYFYTGPAKTRAFVDAVNAASEVDLVVHTGDMLENGDDWSIWTTPWSGLNAAYPQILVPGNHDFAGSTYAQVAAALGRGSEATIAGSQFNHSFSMSKGSHAIRMIVADTNMDASGTHGPITTGIFTQDVLDWIEAELAASAEDDVLLWTHHSLHALDNFHFTRSSALELQAIVDAAVSSRPSLRVTSLFGHYHRVNKADWHSLGPNLPGVSCAAAVELESTRFSIVYAWPENVYVEEYAINYPHP